MAAWVSATPAIIGSLLRSRGTSRPGWCRFFPPKAPGRTDRTTEDRQPGARWLHGYRLLRQSSEVFCEAAEHLGPVGVDFFRRRRRAVLGQHSPACLKRPARMCDLRSENLFQDAARKAIGRNALSVSLCQ